MLATNRLTLLAVGVLQPLRQTNLYLLAQNLRLFMFRSGTQKPSLRDLEPESVRYGDGPAGCRRVGKVMPSACE